MTTYRAWNLKPLDRSALKELTAAIAQQSTEELENRAMETMDAEPWSEEKYQMTLAAQQKEAGLLAGILAARGITDPAEALTLLSGEEELTDPMLLTDMDKACARILDAIDREETIVVFGDYDVDGVTATALLYQHLKGMGANVKCMLPSREGDGYGLSKNAIQSIHDKGCQLIVTVDNGISALEEAEFAASLGVDLIVTDHHLPHDTLPKAVAVVDPRRADDTSLVAQLRLDDAGAPVLSTGDALPLHAPLHRQQQLFVCLIADTAADSQRIRLEHVDHVDDAAGQIAHVFLADALAHGITLPCRDKCGLAGHAAVVLRHHLRKDAVRMGRQRLCRHPLQRRGGGVLLPAAAAAAGARQTVLDDDGVSHLAGHAIGAVVHLAVVDDARAYAGAQRDGHEALAVPSCAHVVFRQRRAVGIVLNIQRDGQIVVEQLPQRHVPQRKVAGVADGAGPDLHGPGHAHAHRCDVVQRHACGLGQLLRHGHNGPRQRLLVGDGCHLHFLHSQQLAVLIRQPRLQVGAADVYAHILHRSVCFSFIISSTLLSNCVTKSLAAL